MKIERSARPMSPKTISFFSFFFFFFFFHSVRSASRQIIASMCSRRVRSSDRYILWPEGARDKRPTKKTKKKKEEEEEEDARPRA